MTLPVLCITSDRYLWALRPFTFLFNTYWSSRQDVTVAGFTRPPTKLPDNFSFFQIANHDYPANKWSDAFLIALANIPGDLVVVLLEDYWLSRTVDLRGVVACAEYMQSRPNVLRFDLTADRLYAGGMFEVGPWGCYDVIETPSSTPYQMSLQAAIWNKNLLRQIIQPGLTAWQVEIYTKVPDDMRVLGTRQWPVRYANAVHKGSVDEKEIATIEYENRVAIERMIPADWHAVVP
jgi:hypothetical protein